MKTRIISGALAALALLPAAVFAQEDARPISITLPSNLPCRAEMEALSKTFTPPTPPTSSSPEPRPTTTPPEAPDLSATLNSAEAKALHECLKKNLPNAKDNAGGLPMKALDLQAKAGNGIGGGAPASLNEKGCPVLTRTLMRGSSGEDVKILQTYLIAQNLLASGLSTGFFGGLTEAAVKKWQSAHGIDPIGIVGPKTRAALAKCTE